MASSVGVASSDMVGSSSSAELPGELQPARPSIATAVIAKTARVVRVLRALDRIVCSFN